MVLLFDIGGSNIRIAVSEDGKTFGEPRVFKTPRENFQEGIRLIAETAQELSGGATIEAAAGGIAGPLDRGKTMLVHAPHIGGWIGKPLKRELEKKLGAPVFLENDTAVIGLGEYYYGAARGKDIAVYITVSTGVGGSRIVHGAVDESAMGFEPGHQIIDLAEDAPRCGCGGYGHLEAFASGANLAERYGKPPSELTDPAIWDRVAFHLAVGLNNVLVFWSPDIVVLGGGMITRTPGVSLERVNSYLKDILTIFPAPPPVVKAELEDFGGLWGALALIKQRTTRSPDGQ